jgi:hypothetical protein
MISTPTGTELDRAVILQIMTNHPAFYEELISVSH